MFKNYPIQKAKRTSPQTKRTIQKANPPYTDNDEAILKQIREKQKAPLTTEDEKKETDKRKYQENMDYLNEVKNNPELKAVILGFGVKNAPPAWNTGNPSRSTHTPRQIFDPGKQRDFTFNNSNVKRTNVYHRAPDSGMKHPLRENISGLLARLTNSKKKKNVLRTFDPQVKKMVENEDLRNLLGSKEGGPINMSERAISGKNLHHWTADQPAFQATLYNKAGAGTNLVQELMIKAALDESSSDDTPADKDTQREHKNLSNAAIKAIFNPKTEGVEEEGSYKKDLLVDRRKLITNLSGSINKIKTLEFLAVVSPKGYHQYPCLILEPKAKGKNSVKNLKKKLTTAIHKNTKIPFGARASFGFAEPTIGDVGASVRIWPGLIPAPLFTQIIMKAIDKNHKIQAEPAEHRDENSPLHQALRLAIARAQERYKNENRKNKNHTFVHQTVAKNIVKAQELLKPAAESDNNAYELRIQRMIKTLDKLNENDLRMAAMQEDTNHYKPFNKEEESGKFKTEMAKRTAKEVKSNGWTFHKEIFTSSGMAAYRIAVLAAAPEKNASPGNLYFETKKLNKKLINNEGTNNTVIAHDPAYNFTTEKEKENTTAGEQHEKRAHIAIYDITNITIGEALTRAKEKKIKMAILFESLSKHFQFGADKTTLGRLVVATAKNVNHSVVVENALTALKSIHDAVLPYGFLSHMVLQHKYFYGEDKNETRKDKRQRIEAEPENDPNAAQSSKHGGDEEDEKDSKKRRTEALPKDVSNTAQSSNPGNAKKDRKRGRD